MKLQRKTAAAGLLALSFALAACGGTGGGNTSAAPTSLDLSSDC